MDARVIAPAAVLLVLVPVIAFAGTTGELIGTVVGDSGMALPGVVVAASSPSQIGAVQTATTGADGSFRFPRLAPGYYTVLVELDGYVPQQLEQVQVRLDRVTALQVVLPPASFAFEVEVNEVTPVVDPVQVSTGQTFTSEYMTRTRTDWKDLIYQTAGASNSDFRRVMGSTPQDGGYLLDGLDSTDWYQRYPNGAASTLPFDAIQEVAVHTAGFGAEFGQATGAVVNVSTKSGGNLFSGTLDLRYTGSSFETEGDHYDPNEQESKNARLVATLGGPILEDRLWFFTTYGRTDETTTPTGAPTTSERQGDILLGKLTWQPGASWSVVGMYTFTPLVRHNPYSDQFRAADATSTFRDEPSIATLETVGVLSPSLLWGLRLGHKVWFQSALPADGDLRTIGHYNYATGQSHGSLGDQYRGEGNDKLASTDVSWLVRGAGSHDLKAGLSLGILGGYDDYCLNGSGQPCAAGVDGFFFLDLVDANGAPIPYEMQLSPAEGRVDEDGEFNAAFVQDAWRMQPNVTLKAGLRWDLVRYDDRIGQVADLSMLQPRVGLAWDIGGDGLTVARASWGRFMHPGTFILSASTNLTNRTEYWSSCSFSNLADPEQCAAYADANGFGYRSDQESWDPAGWLLYPGSVISSEPARVADDLRPNYADEWLVGFEREIARGTSIELTYVNKSSKDGFEDTCNGNVPEPNPDAECDFFLVANLPEIRWSYEAWMLRFESRVRDYLHLLASWVLSESKGSMAYNTSRTGDFDIYPFHFVNRYGHLPDHSRHRLKLNGYLLLPLDFTVAINGWWDSDFRWTPLNRVVAGMPWGAQFVEPRGSRKGGDRYNLDLQLGKAFRIGRTRLEILARIVNVLDSENPTEICERTTGCGGFAMGDAIAWQQPRRFEAGFRVEF